MAQRFELQEGLQTSQAIWAPAQEQGLSERILRRAARRASPQCPRIGGGQAPELIDARFFSDYVPAKATELFQAKRPVVDV
jgi:hypothetical protein